MERLIKRLKEYKVRFFVTELINTDTYPFYVGGTRELNDGEWIMLIDKKIIYNENGKIFDIVDGEEEWAEAFVVSTPEKYVVEVDRNHLRHYELEKTFGKKILDDVKYVGIDTTNAENNLQGYYLPSFEGFQFLSMNRWTDLCSKDSNFFRGEEWVTLVLDSKDILVRNPRVGADGFIDTEFAVDLTTKKDYDKSIKTVDIISLAAPERFDVVEAQMKVNLRESWTKIVFRAGYDWAEVHNAFVYNPEIYGELLTTGDLIYIEESGEVVRFPIYESICELDQIVDVNTPTKEEVEKAIERVKVPLSSGWVEVLTKDQRQFSMLNPEERDGGLYSPISMSWGSEDIKTDEVIPMSMLDIYNVYSNKVSVTAPIVRKLLEKIGKVVKVEKTDGTYIVIAPLIEQTNTTLKLISAHLFYIEKGGVTKKDETEITILKDLKNITEPSPEETKKLLLKMLE